MHEEYNKVVIRRVFDEFVNRGDFSVVDEIYRADVVDHQPLPGAPQGRDGVKYTIAGLRTGFPDLHVTIEEMSAHRDYVVIHNTWRGTHLGEFLGLPATGRAVEFRGVVVWRLADGLIAERWGIGVESSMLSALGLGWLASGAAGPGRAAVLSPPQFVTQVLPIVPGASARWSALRQQLAGSKAEDYQASRRRGGIVGEWFRQQEVQGMQVVVHSVQARSPGRAMRRLTGSTDPFDSWLREAARSVFGVDPWARFIDDPGHPAHEWRTSTPARAVRR
ncbi:ester cyclase [Nocardia sp. BMG51109]|uniref:ester cyclase n=1 Tax=Nocardia sp. BMG51109 TaxID=1056816 RepID=UPI0004636D95|nr:ester cyclase [Nocardia sp. BMG51109]